MALPRDREAMLEEIIEKHAERFRDWEDRTWDEGLALYGKSKPQPRLQWYMSQTLPADQALALDPDYRANRKALLDGLMLKYGAQVGGDPKQLEQMYISGAFMDESPFNARPFRVEQEFQRYQENATLLAQAQQEAEEMGSTLPPDFPKQVQPPPMMWVQLMGMSGRFMQKVQRDFRHCLDEQAKREGMTTPQPQPVASGY
jgi:hypothetical protein